MLHDLKKPALHPVNLPALHLRAAYLTSLEQFLRLAQRAAAEQQAAAGKGRAL